MQNKKLKPALSIDEVNHVFETARKMGGGREAMARLIYDRGLHSDQPDHLILAHTNRLDRNMLFVWRYYDASSAYEVLMPETVKCLQAWINERFPNPRARDPLWPLFPALKNNSRAHGKKSVCVRIRKLLIEAGLPRPAQYFGILRQSRCHHIIASAVTRKLTTADIYEELRLIAGTRSAMHASQRYFTKMKMHEAATISKELAELISREIVQETSWLFK